MQLSNDALNALSEQTLFDLWIYSEVPSEGRIEGIGDAPDARLDGGPGNDLLHGGEILGWDDPVYRHIGAASPESGIGNDSIYGRGGADLLIGGEGDDLLEGGPGNDYLIGDVLMVPVDGETIGGTELSQQPAAYGGYGNDVLIGGTGDDYLHGGSGINLLDGGPGDDTLISRGKSDHLTGGDGADHFDLRKLPIRGVTISDFAPGVDRIQLNPLSDLAAIGRVVLRSYGVDMAASHIVEDGITLNMYATATEGGTYISAYGEGITLQGVDPADLALEYAASGEVFIV